MFAFRIDFCQFSWACKVCNASDRPREMQSISSFRVLNSYSHFMICSSACYRTSSTFQSFPSYARYRTPVMLNIVLAAIVDSDSEYLSDRYTISFIPL